MTGEKRPPMPVSMLTGAARKIAPQAHAAGSALTKVARVACKPPGLLKDR
jgi:hypothetical protein